MLNSTYYFLDQYRRFFPKTKKIKYYYAPLSRDEHSGNNLSLESLYMGYKDKLFTLLFELFQVTKQNEKYLGIRDEIRIDLKWIKLTKI